MARLSDEEKQVLKRLQDKAEAPDEPPMGKSVSFSLDLGDEVQIKRAVKLGLLSGLDDDDDSEEGEGGGEEGEGGEAPKRRGYFGS